MLSLPRSGPARLLRGIATPLTSALAAALVLGVLQAGGGAPTAVLGATDVVSDLEISSVAYQQALTQAAVSTPKVTVIGTGGTIAGVAPTRSDFTNYRSGQIPIASMVSQLQPEIGKVATVDTVQFGNKGSGGYTIPEFHALALEVDRALETADGVVVTTGTDTMEEFAYWLDLTVRSRKPVVLTGAMRPWAAERPDGPQVIGADGPANLYNAIVLAASQRTYCYGAVLMLNDEFHAARDVTKASTTRMDTFETRRLGVLGWIDGPVIKVGRAPSRVQQCDSPNWATPFDLTKVAATALPRTEVVSTYQQAGGEAITAFAEAGVKGIVTAGTGAGGVSSAQGAARTAAARNGVTFVSTSRVGSGSVSGSNPTLPILAGEDLLPQKARLLLMLSLAFAPDDPATVRQWVLGLGNPQFSVTPAGGASPSPAAPSPATSPSPAAPSASPSPSASLSPSGSPSPSPAASSASPSPTGSTTPASLTPSTTVLTAGERVTVRYQGRPGEVLTVLARTQPATSFSRIATVTLDDAGRGSTSHAPQKNTRLALAAADGSAQASQPLVQVRSVASLNAARTGVRTYRFSGRVYPARDQRVVSLYRNGVLAAQGRSGADGVYGFSATLPAGAATVQVRTGDDTYNLGASSREVALTVS